MTTEAAVHVGAVESVGGRRLTEQRDSDESKERRQSKANDAVHLRLLLWLVGLRDEYRHERQLT
jgi:hypothetical protein